MSIRTTILSLTTIAIACTCGMANAAINDKQRLSLNPYGSFLEGGASFIASQSDGAVILPTGRPQLSHGFTVPQDYKGEPLVLEVLVASEDTYCTFALRTSFLFVSRAGEVGPIGTNFPGMDATTTHTANNHGVYFQAPVVAQEAVLVRYGIEEFSQPLEPGDAISFGLFRAAATSDPDDTCEMPLHVSGMSIIYNDRSAPGGLTR